MTDLIALGALLDDAETYGLVVNALESASAEMRLAGVDSLEDRPHFERVAAILDQVAAALHATSVRVAEPGDTFSAILADRGAHNTLQCALAMYSQAVADVRDSSTDVATQGACELALLNARWILEVMAESTSSP